MLQLRTSYPACYPVKPVSGNQVRATVSLIDENKYLVVKTGLAGWKHKAVANTGGLKVVSGEFGSFLKPEGMPPVQRFITALSDISTLFEVELDKDVFWFNVSAPHHGSSAYYELNVPFEGSQTISSLYTAHSLYDCTAASRECPIARNVILLDAFLHFLLIKCGVNSIPFCKWD